MRREEVLNTEPLWPIPVDFLDYFEAKMPVRFPPQAFAMKTPNHLAGKF